MEQGNILSMKVSKTDKKITITVDYFVPEINRNRTEEISEIPHQDFNAALLSLSPFLCNVFHSDDEGYVATGFKYTTNDKVIITGKVSTASGQIVGIATPAIDTNDDTYGFEDEFSEALSTLVMETYQLLIGKKVGVKQLSIEDQPEQEYTEEKFKEDLENEELALDDNVPPDNDEFVLP
jgi:hypothetical protein